MSNKILKAVLPESEMPRQWYNLAADLPKGLNPPLGPDGKPVGPEMLAPVFPMNLIEQEVSTQRWIDIPEEILQLLAMYRPSPLDRAVFLEQARGTPARLHYHQNPFPGLMMPVRGAKCIPSPSHHTKAGRDVLARDPECPGSLGIAISEAVEEAVSDSSGQTRYSLGSVLNHVLLHQTIIGLEAKKQLLMFGEKKPDG